MPPKRRSFVGKLRKTNKRILIGQGRRFPPGHFKKWGKRTNRHKKKTTFWKDVAAGLQMGTKFGLKTISNVPGLQLAGEVSNIIPKSKYAAKHYKGRLGPLQ